MTAAHDTPAGKLDYDRFVEQIVTLLALDQASTVGPDDELYGTVGLDSLQTFQLLVLIEDLAGTKVIPDVVPDLLTMRDAFAYYESLW